MQRTQDDDDWFEALAGRARPGADLATVLEATLLRSAARRWSDETAFDAALPAEESLIARARAAGLSKGSRGFCAGCAQRWRAWSPLRWHLGRGPGLALAALVALVAIGVLLPSSAPDDTAVFRGSEMNGVWLLRDAEPQRLRERIAADLEAAGVRVLRYERLGRHGLEAELPSPPSPAVLAAMQRHRLVAGGDGLLHLEVEAAAP